MPRIGMLKQEKEEFKVSLIKELKKKGNVIWRDGSVSKVLKVTVSL